MSARAAIDNLGDCYLTPGKHRRLMALVRAHRDEILHEALGAIQGEQLVDDTGAPDDIAYSQAITDAFRAVSHLIDPEVSP